MEDQTVPLTEMTPVSEVAIFANLSYDDSYGSARGDLDNWLLHPDPPMRIMNLTTGGHSSPKNRHEDEKRKYRERLWFDFHLKGMPTGVEDWAPYRFAIVPEDEARVINLESVWDIVELEDHPDVLGSYRTFYLEAGGLLSETAPTAAVGADLLLHHNLTGESMEDYVFDFRTPEEMQPTVPLVTVPYDSAPLVDDLLLLGTSHATVHVNVAEADFQLQVALVDVDPSGAERMITSGFRTIREHPGGPLALEVPLSTYGYRLHAGHRLRVQVENLAWHRPPLEPIRSTGQQPTYFRAVPVWTDYAVEIQRTAMRPSQVDLCTYVPTEEVRLQAGLASLGEGVNPNSGALVRFRIYSDSSKAGWDYQFLAGYSGSLPPHTIWGIDVPVAYDTLTALILGTVNPAYGLSGTLDDHGSAVIKMPAAVFGMLPPGPLEITAAAAITDQAGTSIASLEVVLVEE